MDIYQCDNKVGILSQVQVNGLEIKGLWAGYFDQINSNLAPYTLKDKDVIFVDCWLSNKSDANNGSYVTFEATRKEQIPFAFDKVNKARILP